MHFKFIEIGANDRGNLTNQYCGSLDGPGLLFEAVPMYFNNIPKSPYYIRKCVAVSDYNGRTEMVYYDRANLSKEARNACLAGCGNISGVKHDHLKDITETVEVPVWDVRRVIAEFDISSVHFFKVDTEGMDSRIAMRLFDWDQCPRIDYFQFETNELTPPEDVANVRVLLESKGYVRVSDVKDEHDSVYHLAVLPTL